jgi:hypothetical protein
MTQIQDPTQPVPAFGSPRKSHKGLKVAGAIVGGGALLGIGVAIGSGGSHTTVKTVAGPSRTVTKTVKVPGPTVTKTVTAKPAPPAAGATVLDYTGHGNAVTPAFQVPASGDYVLSWTFSGNTTGYGGDNFAADPTDSNVLALGTPNDIATTGSGSTEITQDPGPTDSFNVQADDGATWTLKVVAAS